MRSACRRPLCEGRIRETAAEMPDSRPHFVGSLNFGRDDCRLDYIGCQFESDHPLCSDRGCSSTVEQCSDQILVARPFDTRPTAGSEYMLWEPEVVGSITASAIAEQSRCSSVVE